MGYENMVQKRIDMQVLFQSIAFASVLVRQEATEFLGVSVIVRL
jgi:hypothetical protein